VKAKGGAPLLAGRTVGNPTLGSELHCDTRHVLANTAQVEIRACITQRLYGRIYYVQLFHASDCLLEVLAGGTPALQLTAEVHFREVPLVLGMPSPGGCCQ